MADVHRLNLCEPNAAITFDVHIYYDKCAFDTSYNGLILLAGYVRNRTATVYLLPNKWRFYSVVLDTPYLPSAGPYLYLAAVDSRPAYSVLAHTQHTLQLCLLARSFLIEWMMFTAGTVIDMECA